MCGTSGGGGSSNRGVECLLVVWVLGVIRSGIMFVCVLCQRLVVCYLLTVVVVSPQGCMPEQPIHLYFDLIYTGGIGCCWRVD